TEGKPQSSDIEKTVKIDNIEFEICLKKA
ncbi:MAG: hypothetical protein US82_C0025G0011, partial [Parcubacteria group bacterium GW2011_GWC1_38_22]